MSAPRLLIVQHQSSTSLQLQHQLQALGYQVLGPASSLVEAVELAGKEPPDLILIDLRPPGPAGDLDAVQSLRRQRLVPLVCLTSPTDRAALGRSLALQPCIYLFEPFEQQQLHSVVESALSQAQSERALRRSLELFEALVELSPDGLIVTDAGGLIVRVNLQAEELYGYPRGELLGQPIDLLVPRGLRGTTAWKRVATAASDAARRSPLVLDVIGRRKDGREFSAQMSLGTLQTAEGRRVLTLHRDMSVTRQLDAQLLQVQKMEAVGQLAGGVAHDFNNLLTVITGYCSLLLSNLEPIHPWYNFLTEIHKAAEKATALTSQLLAFSRRQMLQPRLINPNRFVADVQRLLRRVLGEQFALAVELEPGMGAVRVDPVHLEQALLSLAVNAREAMLARGGEGGTLTVSTARVHLDEQQVQTMPGLRPGQHCRLTVRDTGGGMTEEVKARAFEPFFTTKEVGKGSGLGLASVYGIVKQSGGHITIDSEPGRGTAFMIYLPLSDEAPPVGPSVAERLSLPRGSETILLAEDDDSVRALAARVLSLCGYTVLEARLGEEALRLSQEHPGPIHLLATDALMPLMSGRQLVVALRRQRPEICVLFLCSQEDESAAAESPPGPEPMFLPTPFTPEMLARRVRETLDRGVGSH